MLFHSHFGDVKSSYFTTSIEREDEERRTSRRLGRARNCEKEKTLGVRSGLDEDGSECVSVRGSRGLLHQLHHLRLLLLHL